MGTDQSDRSEERNTRVSNPLGWDGDLVTYPEGCKDVNGF